MSHTTPSIYPTSTNFSQNTYQGHQLGYLSSTNSYNPPISQHYNSLGHSYTNKSILGNINSLGQQSLTQGLGPTGLQSSLTQAALGQTSLGPSSLPSSLGQNVLVSSLAHQSLGTTSLSTGVLGQTSLGSTALGNSIVPCSYTTTSMANPTFTNPLVANNPVSLSQSAYNNPNYNNPVTSTLNQYNLPYNPITTSNYTSNVTFSNPLSSQFNSIPLSGPVGMSIKLKPLEEVELGNFTIFSN